ncbi:MAG: FixH family protein [Myxococcota bacterium]
MNSLSRGLAIAAFGVLLVSTLTGGCDSGEDSGAVMTAGGSYSVRFQTTPDPLPLNEHFDMVITVEGAGAGAAVATEVSVDATMPLHGHGMNVLPTVEAQGDGRFVVEGMLFHMPGQWRLVVRVGTGDGAEDAVFEVEVTEQGGRVVGAARARAVTASA